MKNEKKDWRLDKWLASQGALSRKDARELVRAGRVSVNGVPASAPDLKLGENAAVCVDNRPLTLRRHLYLMMNKPAGVVCATRDCADTTVLDLVPPQFRRPGLFPAGRLDKDSEGFVLITDDGDFAHKILAPKSHVPKTYDVTLDGGIDEAHLVAAFAKGITLDGGDQASPSELIVHRAEAPAEATVTIYEGMYHQVKRMFERFGLTVTALRRVRIGGLTLDPTLVAGACREIVHNELQKIN
ncbi:MAG: rRNA pseudouridine synthase [Oscillospiraceae bacterium]|jgi:16S rRNA pseudouridine516 synthase|nr:rRNA pseudouridine synthase [Oscillospiraceae bacterium]